MTNELLEVITGGLFPRSLGCPWRCNTFKEYYIANSVKDVEEFIEMCNETNCFISIYPYTEYTQTNRNKMSAIINVLAFDFDDTESPSNSLVDVKKLLSWAKRHNITPRVNYSGNKGMHVYIDLEPIELVHVQETIKKFFFEMNIAAGFKTLDLSIAGDLERIIRIPNTKHSKTGRYCIALNPQIVPLLNMNEIEALASKKSSYIPVRYENGAEIRALLEEYDQIVGQEIEEMKIKVAAERLREENSLFPGTTCGVPCLAFKEYMANGAKEGSRNYACIGVIHKLRTDGMTKDKTFRLLQEFGAKCDPPLSESEMRSSIDNHWKKSYSLCTFFSKVSQICITCPNRKF